VLKDTRRDPDYAVWVKMAEQLEGFSRILALIRLLCNRCAHDIDASYFAPKIFKFGWEVDDDGSGVFDDRVKFWQLLIRSY
jgi:hypothetical protein